MDPTKALETAEELLGPEMLEALDRRGISVEGIERLDVTLNDEEEGYFDWYKATVYTDAENFVVARLSLFVRILRLAVIGSDEASSNVSAMEVTLSSEVERLRGKPMSPQSLDQVKLGALLVSRVAEVMAINCPIGFEESLVETHEVLRKCLFLMDGERISHKP